MMINNMNKLGLLIIDFDDTLIDNTKLDLDSFHYIAKIYNLSAINDNTIMRWRKNGMIAKNILCRLFGERYDMPLDVCVKKRLEYLKRGGGGLRLVRIRRGAKDTLKQLRKVGYSIVVVTSRDDKTVVKKIIKNLYLDNLIDSIYCASDITAKNANLKNCVELKKRLYRLALKDHIADTTSKKVIVIGNLKADVIAAKSLKIKPIAIKGSYRFDSGISKMCKTITNFKELVNILER